ncbi:MAG: mannose-1-phosphate guanylyltransferase/mannose-6-phosphate isomerase [Gammaproteobacteria bacterium]|nr:mannose-1-phosphate guanylyltransferase/mannose-6-phosphate isomerase [Gammaproteobacteria bacterium]
MRRPVFPVVLSGGAGSRLWPLSRETYPKQLIALVDEHTLLQATALRLATLKDLSSPIVVCNEEHRFMVAEQLQAIGMTPDAILLEPMARNTAPAIATAALEALSLCGEDDEPILLVMPTDHVIRDNEKFACAIQEAVQEAATGKLVAFGAAPDYAETGYGYIKAGPATGADNSARVVETFVEKPDREEAVALIETGDCYWNSGMFVFGARRYLEELDRHAAPVREAAQKAHENAKQDLNFLRLDADCFAEAPNLSVDYAVMEHTSDAVVVPFDAGWSDIGSWTALMELSALAQKDEAGNIVQGDTILRDTRDTYIRADSRIVATLGVANLVIVDTPDALLVADRNATQDTRKIVEQLRQAGRDEHRHHRKVYRPWGHYERVDGGEGFQVKRLTIRPGGRLSLQMHRHRAEHWVVVRGTAKVTRGEETFMLSENQSTYIPQGTRHRLENPTEEALDLIEVQSGSYLGEDDIVRFEDIYGRSSPKPSEE